MADQISGEKPTEKTVEKLAVKTLEKPDGVNRYALQCAIVASIVSIIFGYGKYINHCDYKFEKLCFLCVRYSRLFISVVLVTSKKKKTKLCPKIIEAN